MLSQVIGGTGQNIRLANTLAKIGHLIFQI
jgi:transcription antitermination factor NusA-like protein